MSNDVFNVQRGVTGKGVGDDTYIISPELVDANAEITISDAAGANTIQLIGGLEVVSSQTADTAVQLTLSNGAVITVLGADKFDFALGGNPLTGDAPAQTYDFAGFTAYLTATPAFTVAEDIANADDAVAEATEFDTLDELVTAYNDLVLDIADREGRTLDADNKSFDAGDAADYEIVVEGITGNADDLTATVTGTGTGTLTFTFLDSDDTVTLQAADLSSYAAIAISAGTVDLTNVTLAEGVDISVSSGVVLTAAQFASLNSIQAGSDSSTVVIEVATQAEADAVIAAQGKIQGTVDHANVSLAAAEGSTLTADALKTANASLNAAIIEAGIDEALPGALADLKAAQAAVADQREAIADFLEASFANTFVEELTDIDRDGALGVGEAVNEDIIDDANDEAADAMIDASDPSITADSDPSITVNGATFNTLTAAQQDANISLARLNLEAYVDEAEAALATAEAALEDGVADLVAIAEAKADALEAADKVAAEARDDALDAISAAHGVAAPLSSQGVKYDTATISVASGGLIVTFVDTASSETEPDDVVIIAAINSETGLYELTDAAALAGGKYTVTSAVGEPESATSDLAISITASYLDDVVATQNALLEAEDSVAEAQDALTESVNDVLNAQDPGESPDYAFEFDKLSNDRVVQNAGGDYSLDFSKASTADPNPFGVVDVYGVKLTALNEATNDLTAFNDAVAAWEVTNGLVDDLAALNDTLTDLGADVTAAEEAITNGASDDPSGLGLNLEDYAATVTFDGDDDVTVFESETDTTISKFGTAGIDRLFFGEGYTFVEMGEDETTADALGDVATLEIFAYQADTGVVLYVENIASAGTGTIEDDMTEVTLTGVDLDALSFNVEAGILSAGEYLIA